MPHQTADLEFMREALLEAREAAGQYEVPVGAVVVLDGKIIGRGHNWPIASIDPTAHAEILAIRDAAQTVGAYRLPGALLYVTLEPCVMCAGAAIHTRLGSIRYGARDEKAGALGSVYDIGRDGRLNHRIEVVGGILEDECASMLRDFFKARRGG
ncbi:MAG TPA: tRNA adenosine(34) deaminase TadA [Candidatus Binataceae bacterium]|nr:tRNA adenosine(34) deaminase TadA [Candidatus Binataceae bacterium]